MIKFCRKGLHEMTPENSKLVVPKIDKKPYLRCRKCHQRANKMFELRRYRRRVKEQSLSNGG